MPNTTPIDKNVNTIYSKSEKLVASQEHKEPFTVLYNQMLQTKMSSDALAIIVYLNSLPKDWIVYRSQIMEHFNLSRDRVFAAFKELKKLGYLSIIPERDSRGKVKEWITKWSKVPEFGSLHAVGNHNFYSQASNEKESALSCENIPKPTNDGLPLQNTGFPHSGEPTIWKNDNYKINNNYKEIILNKTTTTTDYEMESPVVVSLIAKMKKESINIKTIMSWIKRYGINLVLEKMDMLEGIKPTLRKTPAHWLAAALRDDYKDESKITKTQSVNSDFEKSNEIISNINNMTLIASKEMPLETKMLFDSILGRGSDKK